MESLDTWGRFVSKPQHTSPLKQEMSLATREPELPKKTVGDACKLLEQMSGEVQVSAVHYVAGLLHDWKWQSSYRKESSTQTTGSWCNKHGTHDQVATLPIKEEQAVGDTQQDDVINGPAIESVAVLQGCGGAGGTSVLGDLPPSKVEKSETETYASQDHSPALKKRANEHPQRSVQLQAAQREKIPDIQEQKSTSPVCKRARPNRACKNRGGKKLKRSEESQHVASLELTCPECNRVLSSVHVLQQHLRIHSGEMPFICPEPDCRRSFRQSSALQIHRKKVHSAEKLFVCEQCSYAAHYKYELTSHVQRFHIKSRDFLCSNCGKGFISKQCLRVHEKGHSGKQFHCTQCDFSTHSPSSLDAHKRNVHKAHAKFVCEICGANMKYQSSYLIHMRKHNGIKPHVCQLCCASFASSSQLKAHIKRVHATSQLECDVCKKKFPEKHSLERHKVTHGDAKPFFCPQCSHRANNRCNLRKHCLAKHQLDYPPKTWTRVKAIADIDTSGREIPKSGDSSSTQTVDRPQAGLLLNGECGLSMVAETLPYNTCSSEQGDYDSGQYLKAV